MRTVTQAAGWAREVDPDTALTRTAIRRLVLEGRLPHVSVGTKRLVALEDLEALMEAGTAGSTAPAVGGIRRVEVER